MKELQQLVEMSKYAGERFDLIQAGGGNTSVKLDDGTMLIKASGFLLSDVELNNGYSTVITRKVLDIVSNPEILSSAGKRQREVLANALVNEATVDKSKRPSIETSLHSLLLKYVLHTHPVLVNIIAARKTWREDFDALFPGAVKVAYRTPGIDLSVELQKELSAHREKYKSEPGIIFLQNHGLIVSSENYNEIQKLNEEVLKKISSFLGMPPLPYTLTTQVSNLLRQADPGYNAIAYLSEDAFLAKAGSELFFKGPFTPDILVFCGAAPLEISSLTDPDPVTRYKQNFGSLPKVVLYENRIFCIAQNVKKAREVEEVLKFHVMTLSANHNVDTVFLADEELAYLSNWEAEKYRQKI